MKTNPKKDLLILLSFALSIGASDAAVVAYYEFDQNLLNSFGSDYSMTDNRYSGSGTGAYVTETVWGQSKYVYQLDKNEGLQIDTSAWSGSGDTYTLIMDVKLTRVSGFQKLASFDTAVSSDQGFYAVSSDLTYLANAGTSPNTDSDVLAANTWTRVAMSRSGGTVTLFLGSSGAVTQYAQTTNNGSDTYGIIGSALTLLRDDSGTSGREDDSLMVSGVWLSDTAMGASDIATVVLPEPSSFALILGTFGCLISALRRRRAH